MAGGGKKGNVVLIEAFIVLCLLFMLQYVIAGMSDSSAKSGVGKATLLLDISQISTAKNTTYHVDLVQIGDALLSLGGKQGCPLPWVPWPYHFETGVSTPHMPPEEVSLEGKMLRNLFGAAGTGLDEFRSYVKTTKGLTATVYKGQVDNNVMISGELEPEERPFDLSVFLCPCTLDQDSSHQDSDLEYPHPVILTLKLRGTNVDLERTYVADYHKSQMDEPDLGGLLYEDSARRLPVKNPLRRFGLKITSGFDITTENLRAIKDGKRSETE
ncbi:hypothetical protein N1937_00960 [Rhizobium sp. WSM4643]|uniref:hypothetical protein n=1 Tax=Rhizobium sp. WSM4643 TaxID=3138253 RepID=UPI0021A38BE0|nr:hypothetical protein [Rhizobium leguminosarum]UWM75851.1 hypothetical protein N1937_00960 [Rhizobium leguminosarum bv. viciae]